jgi:hypothetical protein
MEKLRSELAPVLTALLSDSEATAKVELDAIGNALGSMAVSTEDIDALMTELERRGREIVAPTGGGAELHLGRVVAAARRLKTALARRPTLSEVAEEAKLTSEQVLVALALLRVMQRSPRDVARK